MIDFILPEIGEGIETVSVSEILVKENDIVKKDDSILLVETDKASMEIPIDIDGKVINILIDISYFPADINQDGIWNVLDVVLVINYIFGLNTLSDEQIINADLNQDEIINVLDIVEMVNIILTNQSE